MLRWYWGVWIKGSNMIVCILLVSNSRGCCLAAPGDHEGAARQPDYNMMPLFFPQQPLLSGVPDYFDRNKILSGYDLSHYQVPHCIRVFFFFVWFVLIHHNFQSYFKLCTYCNILDIYLS